MKILKFGKFALAVLAVGFSLVSAAPAQTVRINLGTLAPRGSVYHHSLQAMGEAWRRAPGGGVKLAIYPDGTQGGEADMVKLMRVGSLQAGLLTAVGLSEIEPGIAGLQYTPMLFRDFDELEYVSDKLRPTLEKKLADKGFVVLFWVDAGWVRYFSKQPILTPDDLKRSKIFVWAGDTEQIKIMKHAGLTPVALETSDVLPGLQSGLIDTAPLPPIFALAGQVDLRAPNMLDLNWAPLVGACVVKQDAWAKIPPAVQASLLAEAAKCGREIRASSRKESENAIQAMKKRGLKVHEISPEMQAQWRASTEKTYPEIRGTLVPADVFDQVQKLIQDYRARPAAK
jgi:TRAP-type C4-dicarboxylate transport system substrate-binding protein